MSEKITHIDSFEGITDNIKKAKTGLEEMLSINMKEEAERYIARMEKCNTETNKSAISDIQVRLLRILNEVPSYVEKHHKTNSKGKKVAAALLNDFKSIEENAKAIEEYKTYVNELKSINELDSIFMDKIKTIHEHYRSSADYMTRTVGRLLNTYNSEIDDRNRKYDLSEPTRLLILKHFIRQFGYLEELADKNKFHNDKLREYVEEKYNGDFLLMNDSVFSFIESPDEYISAVTKLQGTIKYKASTILMNKKLIAEICSVMEDSVLSDKAKNGTAVFLSDCFVKSPYDIDIYCFKDCFNINNTQKYKALNEMLKKRCQTGRWEQTDFTYQERLYSLIKNHSDSFILDEETGKIFCCLFNYAFIGYPNPKEISKIFNKDVLNDEDVINSLPPDIISESGISAETRFRTMMTKLSRDILCSQELRNEICSVFGSDEIMLPLPDYKISVESRINKELLKKHKISEEDSLKLTDILEKELLGKETLCSEDYLDLFVNHYGKHIKIQTLKPEYIKLFSNYLIFNKKNKNNKYRADSLTVADVFEVEKIKFPDCKEEDIKMIVDNFESTLLAAKRDKKEEREKKGSEYISELAECIGEIRNTKIPKKITKDNYSKTIRMITVLTRFAEFIPAEEKIFNDLTNAIPSISFEMNKSSETLFDIVKGHTEKIRGLREYDNVVKNEEALSAFLKLTEKYTENNYCHSKKAKKPCSYEDALKELLFNRYNEAIKASGFLYKENKKLILSETNPGKENYEDSGYAFLYMANKLANAEFSGQGESSREFLYIFATAFEMIYGCSDISSDDYEIRDIEKNLFLDYYCDNIVNDPESALNDKKKLVSGKGINYKNFAETAFLWALSSEENKTAKEKLLAAYDIIFYCRKNGKTVSEFDQTKEGIKDNNELTLPYQNDFNNIVIKEKSRENIKKYLINNFPCVNDNNYFGINAENRTAKKIIDEQGEKINTLFKSIVKENGWNEYDKTAFFESCYNFNFTCDNKEMQKLLLLITKRLNTVKNNRLTYNQVCRTTLLIQCYYYMRMINLIFRKEASKVPCMSFSKYYRWFCKDIHGQSQTTDMVIDYDGADNLLKKAGYQCINPKNILDIYLIFLAYRDAINGEF